MAFIAVIACALVLRRLLVAGVVYIDDLGYSQAAVDLLGGRLRLEPWPAGQARVGLYGPVALSYLFFGVSEWSTLLFPLASSLASVAAAYALGRLLSDERAGLVAAFLWAVFPVDVLMAGSLLPDGPMTMLSALAVWFFLRADLRAPGRRTLELAAAGLCVSMAVLVKPLALFLFPFFVLYTLIRRSHDGRTFALVLALLAVSGTLYAYYHFLGGGASALATPLPPLSARLAATATDWTHRLLAERGFAAFTPLAIVATVALLARPTVFSWVALLWAGSTFLIFELGTVSFQRYTPIPPEWRASQVLPTLLPFAVAGGIYLGQTTSLLATRGTVIAASTIVALIAWAGSSSDPLLSWAVTGRQPSELPFARVSDIVLAAATFGAVVSPMFVYRGPAWLRGAALGTLLAATGVSSIHPAQMAVLERREAWHDNLPAVVDFLRHQPDYPIYVQNRVLGARLNLASRGDLGFDFFAPSSTTGRLRVAPASVPELGPVALVVVDDEHLQWSGLAGFGEPPAFLRSPPAEWTMVFSTGAFKGHGTRVYRFSGADAQQALQSARNVVKESPTADNWAGLVRAAAGARDFCAAAAAWLRLRAIAPDCSSTFEPAGLLRECFVQQPGVVGANLLKNGDFAAGTRNWERSPDADVDLVVERDVRVDAPVVHAKFRGGNWAVLVQQTSLSPDTAYVYSMHVRSTAPIVSLYWQADVGHPFEENRVYHAWTPLVSVFITPKWDGRAVAASFSPILVMAPGDVWVADVRLARFSLEDRAR